MQPIRGKEGVSGGNGRRVTSPYASAVADYLGKSVLVCPFLFTELILHFHIRALEITRSMSYTSK